MTDSTRGRRSKVDLLPDDIRKTLDTGLRDGSITQMELLNEVNALIEAAGLPEEQQLSRTGLNRYASKMEPWVKACVRCVRSPRYGPQN